MKDSNKLNNSQSQGEHSNVGAGLVSTLVLGVVLSVQGVHAAGKSSVEVLGENVKTCGEVGARNKTKSYSGIFHAAMGGSDNPVVCVKSGAGNGAPVCNYPVTVYVAKQDRTKASNRLKGLEDICSKSSAEAATAAAASLPFAWGAKRLVSKVKGLKKTPVTTKKPAVKKPTAKKTATKQSMTPKQEGQCRNARKNIKGVQKILTRRRAVLRDVPTRKCTHGLISTGRQAADCIQQLPVRTGSHANYKDCRPFTSSELVYEHPMPYYLTAQACGEELNRGQHPLKKINPGMVVPVHIEAAKDAEVERQCGGLIGNHLLSCVRRAGVSVYRRVMNKPEKKRMNDLMSKAFGPVPNCTAINPHFTINPK